MKTVIDLAMRACRNPSHPPRFQPPPTHKVSQRFRHPRLSILFLENTSESRPNDTSLHYESLFLIPFPRHRDEERREKVAGREGWYLKPLCDGFLIPIRHTVGLRRGRGWSHSRIHQALRHLRVGIHPDVCHGLTFDAQPQLPAFS
jgi:hypothetical protein